MADAPDSKSGPRKRVWVQVPPSVLYTYGKSQPADLPLVGTNWEQRCGDIGAATMAAIEERCGRYRIHFRWHGRQEKLALGKVSAEEAASKAAQVDYLLMRLKQRLIELPPDVDIVEFVQFDGKPPADLQEVSADSRELTLAGFRDRYMATHRDSLEDRTIEGIGLHFKHLVAAIGERFPIRELKLADLQGYVDRRAKAKGMSGRRLSSATIKKELVTLRTAWNWAEKMGMVA